MNSRLDCPSSTRSNASSAPTIVGANAHSSMSTPVPNVLTSHERRLARRAAARQVTPAAAVPPPVTIRQRGNTRFPQPKLIPIPEEVQVLLGPYYEKISSTCLRNVGLRLHVGPVEMRKCYEDQCKCEHLANVRICNSFSDYLRDNFVNGIDCLTAAQLCPHDCCKFWPCNLIANKKSVKKQHNAAVAAAAAKVSADAAIKFKQFAVFADHSLMVKIDKPKSMHSECTEKARMKVDNPMLYAVWMLPQYRTLTNQEFLDSVHKDYESWNVVKTIFINSTGKVDDDDDEWCCDVLEIEQKDHREQYADFLSAQLEIPLSRDIRVLGSQAALSIASDYSDIFAEYSSVYWKSGNRLEVLGEVETFNNWLSIHPAYAPRYQLFRSGVSWRNAKKMLNGNPQSNQDEKAEEEFDWNAKVIDGFTPINEKFDIKKHLELMESLSKMKAVDIEKTSQKKKICGSLKSVKEIRVLKEAPEFLDDQDSELFVERDMQGRFAVYIKLEKKFLQEDLETISDIWAKFRVGPGRASFLVAGREMYLCISGSIKKISGFCEMFEKFPGFIAALQKKKYLTNDSLHVVPVHSTRAFSRTGNKIQLTYVQESSSKKQDEDTGFDFAPDESFEDVRKGESGAHELCDILVNYFK